MNRLWHYPMRTICIISGPRSTNQFSFQVIQCVYQTVNHCILMKTSKMATTGCESSFSLWKTAKEHFDFLEREKRVESALSTQCAIVFPLTTAPATAYTAKPQQRKRDDIPASTFMEHLLTVHKDHCAECHRAHRPTSSSQVNFNDLKNIPYYRACNSIWTWAFSSSAGTITVVSINGCWSRYAIPKTQDDIADAASCIG